MDRWSRGLIDELIAGHPAVRDCASRDLLSIWTALGARIHQDGMVGLQGNLPANLAEQLVAGWKEGEVLRGSNPAVDVIAGHVRYQVKCVRRTDPGRNSVTTLPGSLDFDELVIAVFEYDLSLCPVLQISVADLIEHASELMTGASERRITLTASSARTRCYLGRSSARRGMLNPLIARRLKRDAEVRALPRDDDVERRPWTPPGWSVEA